MTMGGDGDVRAEERAWIAARGSALPPWKKPPRAAAVEEAAALPP
jgi:hypothetical protein